MNVDQLTDHELLLLYAARFNKTIIPPSSGRTDTVVLIEPLGSMANNEYFTQHYYFHKDGKCTSSKSAVVK